MESVQDGDRIVARLDPGEQVMAQLRALREQYTIDSAFFVGIGAVDRATLGHYDVEAEEYTEETLRGQFEVTNFTGNIGPDKIHAHITLGRDDFSTVSGHCAGARVSGTFELLLIRGDTPLRHERDDRTGLDVFAL